ncbi:MAG: hypothetical protein Q8N13_11275 [Acidovorax sp.]|nr:hypothetical protein [Acidovorax sp.]
MLLSMGESVSRTAAAVYWRIARLNGLGLVVPSQAKMMVPFSQTLPRRAEHQSLELFARESDLVAECIRSLGEAAQVQAAGTQPDADAVVHRNPHPRGASVGEEVGVVRLGEAEDLHETTQAQCAAVQPNAQVLGSRGDGWRDCKRNGCQLQCDERKRWRGAEACQRYFCTRFALWIAVCGLHTGRSASINQGLFVAFTSISLAFSFFPLKVVL